MKYFIIFMPPLKSILGTLSFLCLFFPLSVVQAEGPTFSDFELTGVVEVISYQDDEADYYYGTGIALEFSGRCALTAAHILVDESGVLREHAEIVFNKGTQEERVYHAQVIIAYTDTDVAFVCIDDPDYLPTDFRHVFLPRVEAVGSAQAGDSLVGIGYPSVGGDTVTAVFGQLTGFLSYVEDRDIVKSDLSISGGISGGPLLNADKEIIGMIVSHAVEETGAEITYALSAQLLDRVDDLAQQAVMEALRDAGLYDEECEYLAEEEVFRKEGRDYYEASCTILVDPRLESVVSEQYAHWCGTSIPQDYLRDAVVTIADRENYSFTTDHWRVYLENLCGEQSSHDVFSYYTPDQISGMRLVKSPDFSTVYAVSADGKRHPFASEPMYSTWYADFSEVQTITAADLGAMTMSSAVTVRPGTLVKIPLDPKVYLVSDDAALRWIADEQTAQVLYGADWALQVIDLPEYLLKNYQTGEEIRL